MTYDLRAKTADLTYSAVKLGPLQKPIWVLRHGVDFLIDLRSVCAALGVAWPRGRSILRTASRARPEQCLDRAGKETELAPVGDFLNILGRAAPALQACSTDTRLRLNALRTLWSDAWSDASEATLARAVEAGTLTTVTTSAVEAEAHARAESRRRAAEEKRYRAMQAAIEKHQAGLSTNDLLPAWQADTGLSENSLSKVVRGTYTSKPAQLAHAALGKPEAPRVVRTGQTGRPTKLTPEILLQIRAEARQGADRREMAARFKTKPAVVKAIIEGRYWSSAMRTALELEQSAPNSPRPAVKT